MEKVIVYGSQYGSTKRYADELSNKTGMKALSYTEINNLSSYDTILYIGGLYAGGVLGLTETIKKSPVKDNQTLIIVTVGLADPKDQNNTDSIKRSISNRLPKDIYNRSKVFHLRGAINYEELNLKHKIMMKHLYTKAKILPPEQQNKETEVFIDTYNKKVDFVDPESLDEIIAVF